MFERDNKGRVPMEKVAMLIWQFRDDPAVVQFMAQFVAKVSYVCNLFGTAFFMSAGHLKLTHYYSYPTTHSFRELGTPTTVVSSISPKSHT